MQKYTQTGTDFYILVNEKITIHHNRIVSIYMRQVNVGFWS